MSLSNIQINNFMRLVDPQFLGVYASNELDNLLLSNGQSVIVNLSKHNEPGMHFVAFYRKNSELIFFDSLAIFLLPLGIKTFIKNQKLSVVFNELRIQPAFSKYCGYYCILFILLIKTLPFKQFLDIFDYNNLRLNDIIVLQLLKLLFIT